MTTIETQTLINAKVEFVNNWREVNHIDPNVALNNEQITQFAKDLQTQLADVSVRTEAKNGLTFAHDANPIPYSGKVGDAQGFKLAQTVSHSQTAFPAPSWLRCANT